jgi:KDO2-lipid IV(A) lauroyltransferase
MEAKVMEQNPGQTMDGAITEMHVRWLENQVRAVPQFWLWTHKRWKRKFTETDKMYQP